MAINSGFRCNAHNLNVDGVKNSSHTKGEAVDIKAEHSWTRWNLMRILPAYFYRIGIGKEFIHVDVSEDKDERVLWLY